jgi:dipeptidyl aminopeptidase/acylaminoacyl peptidase
MDIRKIIRPRCCFFKLSTVFAVVALALLFVTLVSFPVHAERWSQPIQVTFDMNIAYSWGGPSMSGDGSRIVFQHKVDGYYEVFVVNTDGTGVTQVTTDQRSYVHLSISGDGSKVVFISHVSSDDSDDFDIPNNDVFVVNTDGAGLTQLTNTTANEAKPSINYDGSKIAFSAYTPEQNSEVFVVNSDGTGLHQITQSSKMDYYPSISDDGNKISFISFEGNANGEIFVSVDLDQDSNAPVTTDNYEDLWHMVDFQINLTATDDLIGVTETYYKISGGSVNTVSAHGQPFITEESANNTLEYWSVDAAGHEEAHTILREIKLDKTAPAGSVIINNEDNSTASTSVTLTLSANDTSGVAQMRFSDNGTYWTGWETYATSKNWTMPSGDGEKIVYVQFKDVAGWVSGSYSAIILLETPKEAPFPTTTYVIAGITSLVIAAAVLLYLKKIKFAKNNKHT